MPGCQEQKQTDVTWEPRKRNTHTASAASQEPNWRHEENRRRERLTDHPLTHRCATTRQSAKRVAGVSSLGSVVKAPNRALERWTTGLRIFVPCPSILSLLKPSQAPLPVQCLL